MAPPVKWAKDELAQWEIVHRAASEALEALEKLKSIRDTVVVTESITYQQYIVEDSMNGIINAQVMISNAEEDAKTNGK